MKPDIITYQPILNIGCDDVETHAENLRRMFAKDVLVGIVKAVFDGETRQLKSVELLE